MDEKIPVSVDFDTSTQGSQESTDYGEQAAIHMIGEEFDDLLDLLNDAPEAVGLQALRNIKQLSLIYTNLAAVAAEVTAEEVADVVVIPEGDVTVHSGY
jgi:hypothetical protein